MLLLSVDTSTLQGGLALTHDDSLIASESFSVKLTYSEKLIPLIDNLLKIAGYEVSNLEGFVVAEGPGSFTGLRVGLTTIMGMAHALKRKVATIPTLDFLAMNASLRDSYICPVMDARKNEVYAAIYEGLNVIPNAGPRRSLSQRKLGPALGDKLRPGIQYYPILKSEYLACSIDHLSEVVKRDFKDKNIVFLGNGLETYQSFLEKEFNSSAVYLPRPFWRHDVYYLAYLGLLKFQNGEAKEPSEVEPFYLRSNFL